MAQKPPAFQFYAKDWNSSPQINLMSMHHRGVYITMLAASWDSEEPGTLPLPIEIAAKLCRSDPRSLRDFVAKWPRCWVEVGSKLVNHKLRENWLNYRKISDIKRKAAEVRHGAYASHIDHSSSSSASSSASAPKTNIIKPRRKRTAPEPIAFSEEFLKFWEAYPRKVAKQEAAKSWMREVNGNANEVIASIERLKPSRSWQEGYIPHPTTFLNQHRWTDEPDPPTAEELRKQKLKSELERIANERA